MSDERRLQLAALLVALNLAVILGFRIWSSVAILGVLVFGALSLRERGPQVAA